MEIKRILTDFVFVFIITLAVTMIVTFIWSLVAQGVGIVDWGTSFRTATVLGVILTVMGVRNRKGI